MQLSAESSLREMHAEMQEIREMQEACEKNAQRALAAILEVSVEFADVQRRLENSDSVLSRLVKTCNVENSNQE